MPTSNTLLTDDIITKEALMILHEQSCFLPTINRQYEKKFARDGAKVGETIQIRKPPRYKVREGKVVVIQDVVDDSLPLTVGKQRGVDCDFDSAELAMELNSFSDQFIKPAMSQLATYIDNDIAKMVFNVGNNVNVSPLLFRQVNTLRTLLNQNLAPKTDRTILLPSEVSEELVTELQGRFNPQADTAMQNREGYMGRTAGFDFMECEHLPNYTVGNKVVGVTVGANSVDGDVTMLLGDVVSDDEFKAGMVFTVAGVEFVHPETRETKNRLYQFAILEDVISTGTTVTVKIKPIFGAAGGDPRQNITALPVSGAAIVFVGAVDQSYSQIIAYHKDAFTAAFVDLPLAKGLDMASRQVMDGVSMRFHRGYDINSDEFISRFDVLYGNAPLYHEWAARGIQAA